jgi:hypothetical protein
LTPIRCGVIFLLLFLSKQKPDFDEYDTMKKTVFLLTALGLMGAIGWAVPTDEISSLRQRVLAQGTALTEPDRAVIDKFWRVALDALLLSEEPGQLVSIRRQIQQERGPELLSLYATAYVQMGRSHLQTAFETVSGWAASPKKTLVERNLIILSAQLESPLLAEIGLERLAHPDDVVRYWAVKTVAGTAVAQQLTDAASGDTILTDKIIKALADRVSQEPSLDIVRNIITFAAIVNRDEARNILIAVAQRRIKTYSEWKVQNEEFDTVLLKTIGQMVLSERESETRAAMARGFAELYSLVVQRYMAASGQLSDEQKKAILTVIAEIENNITIKVLGVTPPTALIRAIQRGTGLDREYETLFGSEQRAGEFQTRLKFDFGKTADGKAKTAPPKLPAPPIQDTTSAGN